MEIIVIIILILQCILIWIFWVLRRFFPCDRKMWGECQSRFFSAQRNASCVSNRREICLWHFLSISYFTPFFALPLVSVCVNNESEGKILSTAEIHSWERMKWKVMDYSEEGMKKRRNDDDENSSRGKSFLSDLKKERVASDAYFPLFAVDSNSLEGKNTGENKNMYQTNCRLRLCNENQVWNERNVRWRCKEHSLRRKVRAASTASKEGSEITKQK